MKIWEDAGPGDIVSFPRKHSAERDYFRIVSMDGGEVELLAVSKEEALAEEAEQAQRERLAQLCSGDARLPQEKPGKIDK